MSNKPITQFGKREAALAVQRAGPTKRSGHVALLLAGTVAVGGGAYALMPGENCAPNQPGMAAPGPAQAGCSPRGSSSSSGGHGYLGGSSSRSSFYGGDSSSSRSPAGTSSSEAGSGGVTRGGFGSFAHAFTSHFSGGG
jgi:hypothetical protein